MPVWALALAGVVALAVLVVNFLGWSAIFGCWAEDTCPDSWEDD